MKRRSEIADFVWYEGDQMHFDAPRYAARRGITVEEAIAEIREMMAKLLPDTPLTVVRNDADR